MKRLLLGLALLAALGCGNHSDNDQLSKGHKNLSARVAPCGSDIAVDGVAGVNDPSDKVYLDDWVILSVCHLDTLQAEAEKAQKPISLYIEGLDAGVQPSGISLQEGRLTFVLERNDKNKAIWKNLLYAPLKDPVSTIHLSAGIQDDKPLPIARGAQGAVRLKKLYIDNFTWFWGVLLLGVFVGIVVVGAKSDLLRDGPTIGGTKQSFSLSRTQMAWWFFLVLAGYVFIWLVTSDRDTIPASLLGLMGISAGTALASVAVSSRGSDQAASRKKLYDDELAAIAAADVEIDAQLKDESLKGIYPSLEQRRKQLETRRANIYLERASLTTISPSVNWWRDLITDDNGAFGLDRVQIAVWTVVLGFIFLYSVLWDLSMPEFNSTLLALMGISSGTYIGFKLPGAKS
jgi:hypothetical protein